MRRHEPAQFLRSICYGEDKTVMSFYDDRSRVNDSGLHQLYGTLKTQYIETLFRKTVFIVTSHAQRSLEIMVMSSHRLLVAVVKDRGRYKTSS